jgi:hypothetical protein
MDWMAEKFLQAVKQRFAFDDWFNINQLGEVLFVKNYFIDDELLKDFRLLKAAERGAPGAPVAITTLWHNPAGDPEQLLRIDFREAPSRAAAHDSLLDVLGQFQSPLISRQVVGAGDVAFGAEGTAAVLFTRANLIIFVASVGRKPLDVHTIAARLDRALTEKPPQTRVASVAAGPAPLRAKFVHGVAPGVRAPIHVEVEGDAKEPPMLRFFTRGGEIHAEGDEVIFESDASDDKDVIVYARFRQGLAKPRSYRCRVE